VVSRSFIARAAVVAALLGAAGAGCAPYVAPAASTGSFFTSPFRALAPEAETKIGPAPRRSRAARIKEPPPEAPVAASDAPLPPSVLGDGPGGLRPAAMVESALQRRGVRFGTDGSVGALYAYMRLEQVLIPARAARAGDVVFFNIEADACADHAGVVESVEDGRIAFREVRDGQVRTSYVDPRQPSARRGPDGRIRNSFLRPRRTDDPPAARYFAGEMLCAVGRVRR
jgi:hypothetical protein